MTVIHQNQQSNLLNVRAKHMLAEQDSQIVNLESTLFFHKCQTHPKLCLNSNYLHLSYHLNQEDLLRQAMVSLNQLYLGRNHLVQL